jgi:hypothetical protein
MDVLMACSTAKGAAWCKTTPEGMIEEIITPYQ